MDLSTRFMDRIFVRKFKNFRLIGNWHAIMRVGLKNMSGTEGYVFFKSDSKSFRLSRIACYEQPDAYTAAWHMQSLPLDKFFYSDSTLKATYFGDIYITWKTNPEDTKVAAAQDTSTPQYPKVGRVENSGAIQVEVRDAFEENKKIFAERVQNKAWNPDNAPTVLENHAVKVVQE